MEAIQGTIDNSNGKLHQYEEGEYHIGLLAHDVSNAGGEILAAGATPGYFSIWIDATGGSTDLNSTSAGNTIDNTNGLIGSNGGIALLGYDITNNGQIISNSDVGLCAANTISNSGEVTANNWLAVYGTYLNNSGNLASKSVNLNGVPSGAFGNIIHSTVGMNTSALTVSNTGLIVGTDNIQLYNVGNGIPTGMVTPKLYYGAKEEWIDTNNFPTYGLEHEVKVAGEVLEVADDIFTVASLFTGGLLTAAKMGAKKVVTAASKKLTASVGKVLSNQRGAIKLEALVGKGSSKALTLTAHAAENAKLRGFTMDKIVNIIESYSQKVYQPGGLSVYAKKTGNYYDVVIVNSENTVVTVVGGNTGSLRTWNDVTKMLNNNGGYSSLPTL